ncbi:MAG: hypothetical protein KatS3mg103_1393 [Phycisphaerales bacterium]|nr:MAG: hypothetical protein KatS3mg103_1393 [Phycisphaerales bacterium]
MLSSRMASTSPGSMASIASSCSSVSTSTSTNATAGSRRRATAATCATRSAARAGLSPARWLSLISTASYSPMRWFVPPPHRTAYFSSCRRPGVVLRVSTTRAGGIAHRRHVPRRLGGHAAQPSEQVQERPLDGQQLAHRAEQTPQDAARARSANHPRPARGTSTWAPERPARRRRPASRRPPPPERETSHASPRRSASIISSAVGSAWSGPRSSSRHSSSSRRAIAGCTSCLYHAAGPWACRSSSVGSCGVGSCGATGDGTSPGPSAGRTVRVAQPYTGCIRPGRRSAAGSSSTRHTPARDTPSATHPG